MMLVTPSRFFISAIACLFVYSACVQPALGAPKKAAKSAAAPIDPVVQLICPAGDAKAEDAKKRTKLQKMLQDIASGGDINATDKNGQTALMYAAALDERLSVCWLVAKGADVTRKSAKGKTVLLLTTDTNMQELLQTCAKEKKKPTDREKEAIYHHYGSNGGDLREGIFSRCRSVRELAIAQKLGVDLSGTHEGKLLAQCGISPEAYAYLVRTGYSMDARGENGETALCPEMPRELAQLMLALGMQTNSENVEQALWTALYANDAEGVTAALEKNPDLLGSSTQETSKYIRFAGSGDVVKALIAAGMNAKETWEEDGKQVNLLRAAIIGGGNAKVVKELLAAGCPAPTKGDGLLGLLIAHCPQAGATAKLLVEAGAEVTDGDLFAAIEARSLPLVKLTLEKGANAKQEIGNPPLTLLHRLYAFSAHKNIPAIADLLIKAGVDVNSKRTYTQVIRGGVHERPEATPLHVALMGMANQTLTGEYHKFDDPELAAERELKVSILRALINKMDKLPTDILSYVGGQDLTPRQWSDIAQLLLDKGADLKAGKEGYEEVFLSIGIYDERMAKKLIAAGANTKECLQLALNYACTAEVVDVLLEAGADPNTALKEQISYGSPGCIHPVVKRLLEAGASTEGALVALGSRSPHDGSLSDEEISAVAKELVAAGAKVDLFRTDDWWQVNPALLKPILASGIDVNVQNDAGNTIMMHWISRIERRQQKLPLESLKLLLQAGAKTDIRNKDGKTALQLAEEKKADDLVKTLKAFRTKD